MFLMQGLTPLPNAQRSLLRFFMGGSVDDGKSTLIGRLLHETDAVAEDELAALRRDSARFSASGHTPGLMAVPPEERNPEYPFTLDLRRMT